MWFLLLNSQVIRVIQVCLDSQGIQDLMDLLALKVAVVDHQAFLGCAASLANVANLDQGELMDSQGNVVIQ